MAMPVANDDLPCQELVELITDYLEERLSTHERERFEAHLVGCSGCRNYLDQMRLTIRATGRLAESDLEPATRARLIDVFRDWKRDG